MAALSLDGFQESQPSGLDLFSLPQTQTAIDSVYYDEHRSTAQLTGTAPIEFNIAAQNSLEYIDSRKTKLYVKARIKHINGDSLKPTEYVGPVNNFLHSMFSQIDITLQNKDQLQIQTLGRQIFPGQSKYFLDAYKKATSVAYRPLIIDLNPHTDKTYQLTTDRGVGQTPIVYHSTE
ncbi:unnamed protein product [Mytilus edulis]|uniref:Uncharacterized protein n=1 Tax=Mytilus edulis TaxID=6550 RepID=A0A8S3S9Y2_MYTED|nr:unnamed protein product [Mytilus edulis]